MSGSKGDIVIHPANPQISSPRQWATGLGGDARNPDKPNLRGRLNWLVIQVGGYSGRPTNAQLEWISRYNTQLDRLLEQFATARRERLARLNEKLKAANLPQIKLSRG